MEWIYDALELEEGVLLERWVVFQSLEDKFDEEKYYFNMNYCFVFFFFFFYFFFFFFPLIWDLELL